MSNFQHGHALLIGVGADLLNTVDDAKSLATILRDGGCCTYPLSQVHLLTGLRATCSAIFAALDALVQAVDGTAGDSGVGNGD